MMIDRRITNGLAWAGVLLVVGVPTADLLSAQFVGDGATVASAQVAPAEVAVVERVAPVPVPLSQRPAAPVAVAAVAPVKPAAPVVTPAPVEVAVATPAKPVVALPVAAPAKPATETASAVDSWINSGKALPSYITAPAAAPTQVVATPPVTAPIAAVPMATPVAPPVVDPIQVASIPEAKIAPVPMPLSMRPKPVAVAATAMPAAVVVPSGMTPAMGVGPRPPANVSADDLADWESGPLSEFLARRQAQAQSAPAYDAGGFYLDEAPNIVRPRDVLVGPANDFFLPFYD